MWECGNYLDTCMSRLTIDLTEQQHQNLKALAVLQGKTIKQYAIERLFPGDADADHAWQELKTLLTRRIEEGKMSAKTFDEIVEEEFVHEARRA